jgi:hypothetical protein
MIKNTDMNRPVCDARMVAYQQKLITRKNGQVRIWENDALPTFKLNISVNTGQILMNFVLK